ncbi:MAG: dicarboxylate/amino acid:cation symporter [Congregibacter sp.]
MSLTSRILLAMAAGIVIGSILNFIGQSGAGDGAFGRVLDVYVIDGLFDVVGRIFVASLRLLVVPLVFVSLVCGSSSLGDSARMGPIAGKTLLFYLGTTAIAVTGALFFAVLISPGSSIDLVNSAATFVPTAPPPLKEVLINIFPSNPIRAMADGEMLQIIVFALLFGYALSKAGEAGKRTAAFFSDLEAVVMKMVGILMELAPYGVFALLARLFADMGLGTILDLGAYFLTVLSLLLLHGTLTYSLLLKMFTGLPPMILMRKMRSVWAFAFSTSSSGATLPVTLRTVEKKLGVSNAVAGFTIPLGATVNMDGTAIMQGVATVFIAEVYGIDLSMSAYATVVLTATLASVGTAAVPGVGLITLAMVLEQAGLPVEGIALIIGVDRLLDMVRTMVNVTGDATAAVVVSKSENRFDEAVFFDLNADADPDADESPTVVARPIA